MLKKKRNEKHHNYVKLFAERRVLLLKKGVRSNICSEKKNRTKNDNTLMKNKFDDIRKL